jgi:hypothetical protein
VPGTPPLPAAPPALLDPSGAPRLGAYAGSIPEIDLLALASPGLAGRLRHLARAKRWTWALAVSDGVLAALAIVEAGWFGGGFAWALDRRTGAILWEGSAAGLPGRHASVNGRPAEGARARLSAGGLALAVERDGSRWRLSAAAGADFALDAVLDAAGAPAPFSLVVPVPGGGVRATQKAAALAASGAVRAAGRTFPLDGGSGGVDFTAGVLARETSWRWAFGTGRAGGAPLGLNLCEGFGVPASDPGENAAFAGEGPWRLPPVAFEVGGERSPWRIASPGREVDLVFRPAGAHRESKRLGILSTRFTQVAGTFEGTVPLADGGALAVTGLPGVVEDHWARW